MGINAEYMGVSFLLCQMEECYCNWEGAGGDWCMCLGFFSGDMSCCEPCCGSPCNASDGLYCCSSILRCLSKPILRFCEPCAPLSSSSHSHYRISLLACVLDRHSFQLAKKVQHWPTRQCLSIRLLDCFLQSLLRMPRAPCRIP